jgi:hypothetical protein
MSEKGEVVKIRHLMNKWLDKREAAKVLRTCGCKDIIYKYFSLIYGAGFEYELHNKKDTYDSKLDYILAINRVYDSIYYTLSMCIVYEYKELNTDVYDKTLVLLEHLELEVRNE